MSENDIASVLSRQFLLIIPELILGAMATVMYLGGTFQRTRSVWALATLGTLVAASLALFEPVAFDPAHLAFNPLTYDPLAIILKAVALLGGAILVLIGWEEVPEKEAADYYASLLVIIAGTCLTAAANDLVTLFLALELISIPTYVLLYLQRTDLAAQESAIKYFLLSIFSSALVLFGFSYLYGLTGTTNLTAMLDALTRATPVNESAEAAERAMPPLLALVALVMIASGIGFRITAVPFHFYAPDVYQGTTLSVAGLLAVVPKIAGFAALFRVLGFVFFLNDSPPGQALGAQAPILFWILAAMTMTVGNVLALLQDNLRRLLAYSSVAHAGYMLIGLAVAPALYKQTTTGGIEAVLFYLVAYGAMTLGAFGVIAYLSTPERPIETVDDLAGVSQSQPGVALMMALFMFSLIGIPLTAGFSGKFLLFMGALEVPQPMMPSEHGGVIEFMQGIGLFRWLAIIGALNAAAGAWYYLRIVSAMYLRPALKPIVTPRGWTGLTGLWVCAAVTLALGVYPEPLVQSAREAVLRPAPQKLAESGPHGPAPKPEGK